MTVIAAGQPPDRAMATTQVASTAPPMTSHVDPADLVLLGPGEVGDRGLARAERGAAAGGLDVGVERPHHLARRPLRVGRAGELGERLLEERAVRLALGA